jgi:uncharacterized protein YecT (DUF1311 family)
MFDLESTGHKMKIIKNILIIIMFSYAAFAQASPVPSYDCNKASFPIEHIICSDAKLSSLDHELAKKYAEVRKTNPEKSIILRNNQRAWLTTRFQQCSSNGKDDMPTSEKKQEYIGCLQELYENRIKVLSYPEFLSPFRESDVNKAIKHLRTMNPQDLFDITTNENRDIISNISCRFFEKDPVAASKTFAVYFGSSADGFNPLCRTIDIADYVPEYKALLIALESIWGTPTECDGTMRFAFGRSEMILRILAAVDPNPMKNQKAIAPLNSVELGYTPDLKHWSQQGNWEKRQYEELQPILAKARMGLSLYYQKKFHVSKEQADEAARFNITQIIREKTERTGKSQTPVYMSLCFDNQDLDAYLKSNLLPIKQCPYGEYVDTSKEATLRRFIGLAIVNNYPIEVIKKLLSDGAELNQKRKGFSYLNDSPLMLAAPYPEIISLLLNAGADVNEQNSFGKTALMYAIQERNINSVSLLLEAKADVNAKTFEEILCGSALKAGNRTPLMYAAWQASPEIIRMLVEANADVHLIDTNKETALDYLQRNKTLSEDEKAKLEKIFQDHSM